MGSQSEEEEVEESSLGEEGGRGMSAGLRESCSSPFGPNILSGLNDSPMRGSLSSLSRIRPLTVSVGSILTDAL